MWGDFILNVYCNHKRSDGIEVPDFEDDMTKINYIYKDFEYSDNNKNISNGDITAFVLSEVVEWFSETFKKHEGIMDKVLIEFFVFHNKICMPQRDSFDDKNIVSYTYLNDRLCGDGYIKISENLYYSPYGTFIDLYEIYILSEIDMLSKVHNIIIPYIHLWMVGEFIYGELDEMSPVHVDIDKNYKHDDIDQLIEKFEASNISTYSLASAQVKLVDVMRFIKQDASTKINERQLDSTSTTFSDSKKRTRECWGET